MCSFTGIFPDFTIDAKKLSVADSREKIDKIMEYDRKLSEPFTEDELAELFKKVDTLAPLGFVEGMQAAEALSEKASQKQVDDAVEDLKICAERRKELDSALTEAELTKLFQKHSWGSRRGWRDYELLTPEEQYFVDKSGWTPEKRTYENNSGASLVEQRRKLKASIIKTPSFQSCQFHNLDKVKLLVMKHETTEKCFYFMNFFSSESVWTSSQKIAKLKTAMPFVTDDRTAAFWLEVFDHITVDKSKLRPEQVKYLEAKVQETLELLKKYKFDIYDDKHWDCPQNYYRNYKLLTKSEKQILDRLKLTPAPQEKCEDEDFFDDANDIVSARRDLKIDILRRNTDDIFSFLGRVGGFLNFGFTVSFARDCYCINSNSSGFSSYPKPPDLIVEKSKLRPDQITYLDRKCEEKDRADAEKQNANKTDTVLELQRFFDDHGIDAEVVSKVSGPRITRYEIEPGIGVSPERIKDLQDEIQMVLQASSIRILVPIPGRAEIGIEVPNENPETVTLKGILYSEQWQNSTAVIPLAIGRNTVGEPVIIDLDHAPHILLAGAAGTGKSTSVTSMIVSMIKKFTPDELQFIMFDPKIVELDIFRDLPHLQIPIVNDAEKFTAVLHKIADEMDQRLTIPSDEKLPPLVIIIDELAALLTSKDKIAVETDIARIAQNGRNVGIHLIISTRHPVDIPVVILANIPTKLCFQVDSEFASEQVLGEPGAETLLGKGDMLMQYGLFTERVQGAWW